MNSDSPPSALNSQLSALSSQLFVALGAAIVCLWLLLLVCLGATDLKAELRALDLD